MFSGVGVGFICDFGKAEADDEYWAPGGRYAWWNRLRTAGLGVVKSRSWGLERGWRLPIEIIRGEALPKGYIGLSFIFIRGIIGLEFGIY